MLMVIQLVNAQHIHVCAKCVALQRPHCVAQIKHCDVVSVTDPVDGLLLLPWVLPPFSTKCGSSHLRPMRDDVGTRYNRIYREGAVMLLGEGISTS